MRKTNLLFLKFVILLVVALAGCKPVERIVNHTEYVSQVKYDSIYVHQRDSIHILEKGDSVFIDNFQTVFKDRLIIHKDTFNRTDTLRISAPSNPTVNKVTVRGFYWWFGLILFWGSIIFLIYKLVTWSPVKSFIKKLLKIK